jgi:hypothetical protein
MTPRETGAGPELPAWLSLRLAAIDDELPTMPRWRPTAAGRGQLHVVRGRVAGRAAWIAPVPRSRRRPSVAEPLAAAAVAIAFFGLGYLVSRPADQSGRFVSPSVAAFAPVASPSPGASSSAPPSALPRPTPGRIGPEIIGGPGDGATLIARRLGWSCRLHGDAFLDKLDLQMVDKLAVGRGLDRGLFATDAKVLVFLGTDADAAAAAFKASLVAHGDDGSTWIVTETGKGPIAHELAARRSPMGRLVWLLGDSEQPVICDGRASSAAPTKEEATGRTGLYGTPIVGFRVVLLENLRLAAGHPS